MLKGIAHVCIAATDLEATEQFYCSGLGFSKVFDFIRNGATVGFYLKVSEDTYIEVFRQDKVDRDAKCPISHLCLEVHDIDRVTRHLKAHGYDVTEKKVGGDRSWQAWTADPAGVRIEFHQYTAESSQITGKDCILD